MHQGSPKKLWIDTRNTQSSFQKSNSAEYKRKSWDIIFSWLSITDFKKEGKIL